ncbi:hypothetical protein C8R45DRAFT_938570 [Mycena sanguinolenta]|nr:hypothetical protein C8R45DRAFT_938570 [Mycena sanguinolenta]
MSYAAVGLALPSFHLSCVPASVPAVPYLDPLPPCRKVTVNVALLRFFTFTFCAMTTTAATARLNEIDGALAYDLNEATHYRHGAWCRSASMNLVTQNPNPRCASISVVLPRFSIEAQRAESGLARQIEGPSNSSIWLFLGFQIFTSTVRAGLHPPIPFSHPIHYGKCELGFDYQSGELKFAYELDSDIDSDVDSSIDSGVDSRPKVAGESMLSSIHQESI